MKHIRKLFSTILILSCFFLLGLGLPQTGQTQDPFYTYLDPPTGWQWVTPKGINDSGTIIGTVGKETGPAMSEFADFIFHSGSYTFFDPGTLYGISNNGMVVGVNSQGAGFIYNPDTGVYTYLDPPAGWRIISPQDINDRGAIIGTVTKGEIIYPETAYFLYQDGSYTFFATGITLAGISNNGMVVGGGMLGFIYNPSTEAYTVLEIPTGWQWVTPKGINDSGTIFGRVGKETEPTIYTYADYIFQGGSYTFFDPGTLAGISSNGIVVGSNSQGGFILDGPGPFLSITSHSNGQQVTTPNITLSGRASDAFKGDEGISQVTVNGVRADNDTALGSATANWSKTITLTAGANTITVVAYDNSPNHNQRTQSIQIIFDPPNPISRPGDYDGDGKTDIAVWRPGDGNWYIRNSATGTVAAQQWGLGALNDWPVPGDYDGEGKIDYGVWRPGDGRWYIIRSSDGGMTATQWGSGALHDVPVPGDYDGDGKTDPAVWRPGDGNWYILRSSDGGVTATQWGAGSLNDLPVPGDYDGDGKTDMAVWRPGDGNWYIRRSSDGSITSTQWGTGTLFAKSDVPVPGDYDGDGKTDIAVWRPGDGMWYILRSSDGGVTATQWGTGTMFAKSDVPVPADYDGDGKTDIAVWRPGDGMWYILRSSDGGVTATQWGSGDLNDIPVVGSPLIYRYLEGTLY